MTKNENKTRKTITLNEKELTAVIKEVAEGPDSEKTVTLYSENAAVFLRYMKAKVPKFSMGRGAGEVLEVGIGDKYPELMVFINENMPAPRKGRSAAEPWENCPGVDREVIERVFIEIEPREKKIITVFNRKVAAFFKYVSLRTADYSVSKEAEDILLAGLPEKCPEVWKAIFGDGEGEEKRSED